MEVVGPWYLWILLAIVLLFFLVKTRKRFSSYGRLPPGPKPLPIVGNLFLIGDLPHRSLAHLAKTYGPLMAVKLGQVTTVVISSPDVAREALQKRDQDFYGRSAPDATRALGHCEVAMSFRPVDQQWRNLRKICNTQLFMSQKINNNQGLREEKVRELTKYLQECCKLCEPVDIGRAAFSTILNMISNTIFSIDMVDPRSNSPQYFKDLIWDIMEESGGANLSDFFPMLAAVDIQGRRRRVVSLSRKMHAIFDEQIDRRMEARRSMEASKATTTTNDFLDSLLQYYMNDNGMKLDRRTIRALLLELFVAGSDTGSSTVEWAMTELLRNPRSMEKARAELSRTIEAGKELDESDIQRLPYLQAVVRETLRLHPPTPFLLPRRTETAVELFGYNIPKGTRVLVNVWAIGRDADVWTNPELFMPERFLENGIDYRGQDFELIPFGAGRRICPGLPLAIRMVHLMLASLLQSFEWELSDGMRPMDVDMTEKFGITLVKRLPLLAIPLRPRRGVLECDG